MDLGDIQVGGSTIAAMGEALLSECRVTFAKRLSSEIESSEIDTALSWVRSIVWPVDCSNACWGSMGSIETAIRKGISALPWVHSCWPRSGEIHAPGTSVSAVSSRSPSPYFVTWRASSVTARACSMRTDLMCFKSIQSAMSRHLAPT